MFNSSRNSELATIFSICYKSINVKVIKKKKFNIYSTQVENECMN